MPTWSPLPWHVKLFLFELKDKGETVAAAQLANLKWLQKTFQVELHTEDETVQAAAITGTVSELQQASPLTPQEWVA